MERQELIVGDKVKKKNFFFFNNNKANDKIWEMTKKYRGLPLQILNWETHNRIKKLGGVNLEKLYAIEIWRKKKP